MGPTGVGKSFFIHLLTDQRGKRASNSLGSWTSEIQATHVRHPRYGDRIVLVDTPGFDGTTKSDMEMLQVVGGWFEQMSKQNVKLSGLIYLHRITDNRMGGPPNRNLRMFGKLCGDVAANQVILVPTHWDKAQHDSGEKREMELWNTLIEKGSRIDRLNTGTADGAWRIVDQLILGREAREVVLLQEELVDLGRQLNETQAGQTLYNSLQRLLADQKNTLKLRDRMIQPL